MEMRLMVEIQPLSDSLSTNRTIIVDGRHWQLSEPLDILSSSSSLPAYTCASYVWGEGRAPNPIHPSVKMSDRTLETFAAVARHARVSAIWIDAFCVPAERIAKRLTLESMGFIYARAASVIAVLASESLAAVREMGEFVATHSCRNPGEEVSKQPLEMLDADMWIRSVWTYQEVVNGTGFLLFVSPAEADQPIKGDVMLHSVGGYLTAYGNSVDKPHGWMDIAYRHVFDFEQLLADWQMSLYTKRSAYLIMSGLNYRMYTTPANYFYSMIGALTDKPCNRATDPTVEALAERFMELCEEKGDYSFIFSSVPRDARPRLRWRPVPAILKSVLTWHSVGSGQPGAKVEGGVLLHNVSIFKPILPEGGRSPVGKIGQKIIEGWMRHPSEGEDRAMLLHRALTEAMRFTGTGGWFATEGGIFYPQHALPDGDITIVVTHGVKWVFGAPGMAVVQLGGSFVYAPGVFVGEVGSNGVSEFLLR
ncbi:hypothetical protein C8Q80DRAFT_232635 [Daedaleopsis nitida]|nr:hypothetical protein C8Q80DRAFT_232635 [Daedaleopsis nitida]